MNVSAINCTPIKPQASFGHSEYAGEPINDKIDSFQKNLVESDDIKSPAGVALSVAGAFLGIYAAGKLGGTAIATAFKSSPEKLETALKKGSDFVKTKAQSLTANEAPGKLNKVKNFTGKVLAKTEEVARKGYKKIAYGNIPGNLENAERAKAAFENAAGAAAVMAAVPKVLTKDSNNDGVNDIMQKSQNAYFGTQTQVNNLTALGEIVTALS